MLSSLKQCCQQKISPDHVTSLPGVFLDLFVRTPLASFGTIGQKESERLTELNGLKKIL